jgi:Carboxypeptidase regulatory-like domain
MTHVKRSSRVLFLSVSLLLAAQVAAQETPREIRVEVRDKSGRPIPDAQITFFLTGDSARTDSAGVASLTVKADTSVNITVRKIGFEPRSARFVIGRAPAFRLKVMLGEAGQRLAEVEVKAEYPGEPWRPGYENRRRRGGGQFRDLSSFAGTPISINDWFNGMPGVRTGGGADEEVNIPRCRRLGVWIDGQHLTSLTSGFREAIRTVPAQDIAALELYMANTPAQYTGQAEDCSLVIWTRLR